MKLAELLTRYRELRNQRLAGAGKQRQVRLEALDLLHSAIDGDEERAEGDEEELLLEADAQHEAALSSALEVSEEDEEAARRRTNDNLDQLLLDLGDIKAERRQLEDNRKYWERRLQTIDVDLAQEPERIRRTFALQTHRVEPAGAIYLWPQGVPAS